MPRDDEMFEVKYEKCVASTAQAVCLRMPDGEEIWFPLSVCTELEGVERNDGPGSAEVPEWIARKKGLA